MASHSQSKSLDQSQSEIEDDGRSDMTEVRRNAHEDTIRFTRELLKDDRLGASVFELVAFLRATVGIVEELDHIEDAENALIEAGKIKGNRFDIIVKAAGWWRILYCGTSILASNSTSTYALDVRMINSMFMIVDGSVNLQGGKIKKGATGPPAPTAAPPSTSVSAPNTASGSGPTSTSASGTSGRSLGSGSNRIPTTITPIPGIEKFTKEVLECLHNGMKQRDGPADQHIPINYGSAVVCGPIDASSILRGLHDRTLGIL
jgi:hypothetical protein